MTQQTLEQTSLSAKSIQLLAAALLGFSIFAITALSPIEVIHNATHDTRHSAGFPCH
ncbi:CbtB domain-containing protein [methane-oxidizing endosymbiont of Gigantopelta aegis]|uniref:CbtB domain-containing protein n=1 Tax=methane-oxidizing endosymbiont of Gigantopelta aegis TaxID=2794938 RepID=UPI0018DD488C|nr:CbtB domain-containing protein [methane-oxidizing endosymbiont of Gigantopelta aegis]